MKELNGIWWAVNQNQVTGKLTITDENKIYLTTYGKLYDTNIISDFAQGEQITLVNVDLDRTDIYTGKVEKNEIELKSENENLDLTYSTYKYIADIAIFGHVYERKGDIRFKELLLNYTNLEKWIDWKIEMPEVKIQENDILLKIKKSNEKKIQTDRFDIVIRNPYAVTKSQYKLQIANQVSIAIENIRNEYLQTMQGIIQCLQFFLILCTGDNINIEKVNAIDVFDRNVEVVLGYGKSNYENRSILKNIVQYKDIEDKFDSIIKNWLKIYEENELLMVNFIQLQTTENLLVSEYMNLMSAIDSLYLLITKQEHTKEHFAEIIKRLIRETNFILNFSEEEIEELAIKVKDIRRYFVHANKSQKQVVHSNISIIKSIMSILIESIRVKIMLEIGIDQGIIEKYYHNIENLKAIKYDIINDINEEDRIMNDREKEGGKIMNPLSKKDKESIAELNAIMGTRYRESEYNLENTDDLIEAIENVTAEYMDYMHYWAALNNIMENFDQSLEVFHPEKWFNMTKEGNTGSNLIDETISSLDDASDNMYELADNAEERCRELWKFLLLGKVKEAQEFFVGDITGYDKEELTQAIEEVIENIYEIKYENQVQNDAKNFAKGIKESLEKIKRNKT